MPVGENIERQLPAENTALGSIWSHKTAFFPLRARSRGVNSVHTNSVAVVRNLLARNVLPTSLPAGRGSDVGLLAIAVIQILGVIPNTSLIKSVFIGVSTGNTNLAQNRPNLPKSYRRVLLTASWPVTILTMDVTRHFTGMVHDKRLQM